MSLRPVNVENGYGVGGVQRGKLHRFDYVQPYENTRSESPHGHYVALVELMDGSMIECVAKEVTFLDNLPWRDPTSKTRAEIEGQANLPKHNNCHSCGESLDRASPVHCRNSDHIPF